MDDGNREYKSSKIVYLCCSISWINSMVQTKLNARGDGDERWSLKGYGEPEKYVYNGELENEMRNETWKKCYEKKIYIQKNKNERRKKKDVWMQIMI